MYTFILAMAILALYALRRAIEANRARWWATLVIATSIAFYAHILAALLIPVEMVAAIMGGWKLRRNGWWKGALVSFACLTVPYQPLLRWQLPLVFTPAQTGYTFYPFTDMLLIMLNAFATGVSGSLPAAAAWPAGLLFIAGVMLGGVRWRDRLILLTWCLLPAVLLFVVSLNRPIFTDRYLIWIGPAFYLLAALGGLAFWRLSKPLGGLVLVAVIGLALAGAHAQVAQPIKSDFRGAARYVEPRYAPGDLIIFQIPYVQYTFDYYYHKPYDGAEGLFTNYGMSDAEVDEHMRAMTAGRQTVWLVASEMTMWDSRLQVWRWLETHLRRAESAEFAQVIVYRYE
jgi:mannosyltransferase